MKISRRHRCFVALLAAICCSTPNRSVADEAPVALPDGIEEMIHPKIVTASLPGLHLNLVAPTRCVLGEPIEITMRISYDGDEKVYADRIDFDRSGRVAAYGFRATDASGNAVRDPAAAFLGGEGGGAVYKGKLSKEQPFEQKVVVNQWLAFEQPGTYTLRAHSTIVRRENSEDRVPFGLESEPLQIEIVAPDETNRKMRLELAQDMLPTPDREIDQLNRQTRFEIARDLRFMLDARAIPSLVGALSDGWINVRFEAFLGLRAFQDLAPVKTELLRVINDDKATISPDARNSFLALLIDADKQSGIAMTPQSVANYDQMLSEKQARDIQKLPLAQSLEMTVAAMYPYDNSGLKSANWNRVLDGAALMSLESQKKAADTLLYHLKTSENVARFSIETLQKMRGALLKTARDEKVLGALRSISIVALARLGDFSQRELLVSEFKKAQPLLWKTDEWGHVWSEAQKTLNGYKNREIALQLLSFLNAPDFFTQDYYPKRSVLLRLSDFGGALSTRQLRKATQRVLENTSEGDSDFREMFLKALARKSPDAVLPFLRLLAPAKEQHDQAFRAQMLGDILPRLSTRLARDFTLRALKSPDERERAAIIGGFAINAQNARDKWYDPSCDLYLPIRPDVAKRFFPQILRAFQTDPSRQVRTTAFYALTQITSIPDFSSYDSSNADDKRFVSQWLAWHKTNARATK